jgi:hypothetical protein
MVWLASPLERKFTILWFDVILTVKQNRAGNHHTGCRVTDWIMLCMETRFGGNGYVVN